MKFPLIPLRTLPTWVTAILMLIAGFPQWECVCAKPVAGTPSTSGCCCDPSLPVCKCCGVPSEPKALETEEANPSLSLQALTKNCEIRLVPAEQTVNDRLVPAPSLDAPFLVQRFLPVPSPTEFGRAGADRLLFRPPLDRLALLQQLLI